MDGDPGPQAVSAPALQNTLEDAIKCCVICLDDVIEPCEAQPCRHSNFDYICLITWLQQRATCPICKSDVRQVKDELGGDDGQQGKLYTVPPDEPGARAQGNSSGSSGGSSSHAGSPGRARPPEDEAIRRRRHVYRHRLFSLHVGSNRRQPATLRYRELTPQLFMADAQLRSRARIWIRRELRVFRYLHQAGDSDARLDSRTESAGQCRPTKAEYLEEYILAILRTLDMQDSTGQAENMIQAFLGRDNTRLFLHELRAWLRSPCETLREWDGVVQYRDDSGASAISPRAPEDHEPPTPTVPREPPSPLRN